MIKPLDNPERALPPEKPKSRDNASRVHRMDPTYRSLSRDFAGEFSEAIHEEDEKKHRHYPGFGEDTYEASGDEEENAPEPKPEQDPRREESDDGSLDITV